MGIAIQNYTFHNLSCLIYVLLKAYNKIKCFAESIYKLDFTANGPFVIRGETQTLEKNYPSIY